MVKLQSYYDKAPYPIQNVLLNLYALGIHKERYGKPFSRAFEEMKQTQWFSTELIYQYQLEKLKAIVKHAYNTVPFYRKRYDEHGVCPRT